MTDKDLIQGMNYIDEALIDEALNAKKIRRPVAKWCALAACFGVAALSGFVTWQNGGFLHGSSNEPYKVSTGPSSSGDTISSENGTPAAGRDLTDDSLEDMAANAPAQEDRLEDMAANAPTQEAADSGRSDSAEEKQSGSDMIDRTDRLNTSETDAPADAEHTYHEAVTDSDLSQPASDIFCGSYTDERGRFVVVLTADTPENRSLICRELDLLESDTIFQVGTYTLSYLTKLQERISRAMTDRKLPFVTSSGVYEDTNRIGVVVTTKDQTKLTRLTSLDELGGAIDIQYSDDRSSAQTDIEDLGNFLE